MRTARRGGLPVGAIAAGVLGLIGLLGPSCTDQEAPRVGDARAAIEVGPEVELEPPVTVRATASQTASVPLRAGDHYLIAWLDRRKGWPLQPFIPADVMAARVADDGTVLDPAGFPIFESGPAPIVERVTGACSDGGVCLIVTAAGDGQIRGHRVDGDQVLDASPIVIADGLGTGGPAVAWDGEQFRVLYVQAGAVASVAVSESGLVGSPVDVGPGFEPDIACGGTRCLVAALSGDPISSTVTGWMLDPAGPVGPAFALADPAGFATEPRLLWDGTRYWVLFVDRDVFGGRQVYLARVSAEGHVLDPAGIDVFTAPPNNTVGDGGIGLDDDRLIVTWQRGGVLGQSVRVTRVSADGVVLDPEGVEIGAPPMSAPVLACGPDACLGTTNEGPFVEGRIDERSVRGYRLDGTTSLDPGGFDVSTAPPAQSEAGATHVAGRYVVVWHDGRPLHPLGSQDTIHGVIFPPTMDTLVPFVTGPGGCGDQRDPKVAGTATSFLVTWHSDCPPTRVDDTYVQAFDLGGQPLGPALDVGNRNGRDANPSVVSSGSEFMVLWEYEEPDPPRSIQIRRYDASGAPLSERVRWNRNGTSPVAAFDGTNYLVVWQRPLSVQESRRDLFAARMAPDGTALDADIPIATLPTIPEDAQSVACGGGVCLIVWRHAGIQIRAVRLGLDGQVLDAAPIIVPTDGPVPTTSVTFDGEAYLVAWETETHEMHGVQITPEGEIVAPGDFLIAAADPTARNPVVVSNGTGHLIEMHERYDASPTTRMRRLRARVIGEPAPVPDAGVPDAAVPDAGVPDAEVPDASPPDAGLPDAGPPDAGPPDASLPDGGADEIDYVVSALGNPPAAAVNGATFSVAVTVRNNGGAAAAASSTTRFFLSADTTVGGDRALARSAAVPPLGGGQIDTQTVDLVIPAELASGSYFLLACADRGAVVPEVDERNNCRASGSTVAVTGPDLVVEAVVEPPPSIEVGRPFSPGDTTRNLGTAAAASSNVAYYLSPVPVRGPTARRLSTTRSTGPIGVGQSSSGGVTVKVPPVAFGDYFVLACADVSSAVAELDEDNNCAASTGTTTVGPPTLR